MDKKLLAIFILASLSPAWATLTKIPAGFEVIAQGQQEYIEVYYAGKSLGKYYAMVNLDTVTFLDSTGLYNKLELDAEDQKIAQIVKARLSQPLIVMEKWLAVICVPIQGVVLSILILLKLSLTMKIVQQRYLLIRNGVLFLTPDPCI